MDTAAVGAGPVPGLGPAADDATTRSVERFLYNEALILDRHGYSDWIPLLEDDFVYEVPVTITRDNPALPSHSETAFLVEENRDSLASLWARRLEPEHIEFAWGENPLLRVRHFVTNVSAFETAKPDEVDVRANVLLTVVRQSDPVVMTPAARADRLRRRGDGWGLAKRTVYLDEAVVTLPHLRLII
jgi:3-phenylpropionate/cinnamic acid dioxygenase small subunit